MGGFYAYRGPVTLEELKRQAPRGHPLQVKIDADLEMLVRQICGVERRSACSLVNMVLREFLGKR